MHRLPGSTDDVSITQPGSYTVIHSTGTDTIHSLTADKNLSLSGGMLNVTTTAQVSATFNLSGATLGSADVVAGTTLVGQSGRLDGVTIHGILDVASSGGILLVTGGLTLQSTGTANLGNASGSTSGSLVFTGANETLGGTGTVVFGASTGNALSAVGGTVLTLGPGISVQGHVGNLYGNFVNQGTITAGVGATINLSGTNWRNTGTVQAQNGGRLNLGGTVATPDLGTISSDASSQVNIVGTLDNAGHILSLDATTGSWRLIGGLVHGGTVATTGSVALVGTIVASTLDGVTINGTLDLGTLESFIYAINGLTLLNGTVLMGNNAGTTRGVIDFVSGDQTLAGTGTVIFGAANSEFQSELFDENDLTIGSGIHIKGNYGFLFSRANLIIQSQATITADVSGGTIQIGSFLGLRNQGMIRAESGGTVEFYQGTPITTANLGSISDGGGSGTINFSATLDNTGSTLHLNASTGSWHLTTGGVILHGVVEISPGTALVGQKGTLDGVTLNGTLDLASTGGLVSIQRNLILNGTAYLGNSSGTTSGSLRLDGGLSLGGNATVVFGAGDNTLGSNFTLGPNVTVRGRNGTITGLTLNQGTITTDVAGGAITLVRASNEYLRNEGTIRAQNGGTINLATDLSSLGSVTNDGTGTVNITGTVDNMGKTLRLNAGTGSWNLISDGTRRGIIEGGVIETADGAVMNSRGGELDGVTLNGTLSIASTTRPLYGLYVKSGITLNSTLNVGDSSGTAVALVDFLAGNSQTIDGTGTIVFGTSPLIISNAINLETSVTIGSGITVRGKYGAFFGALVINQGTIEADEPDGDIYFAGMLTNAGTVSAANGATVEVFPIPTNFNTGTLTGGTWQVHGNSSIQIDNLNSGIVTNAANILLDGANANFFRGFSHTDALATLTTNAAAGSLTIENGHSFTALTTFTNNGTLTVGAYSTFTGVLSNLASGTLTNGTYIVRGTLHLLNTPGTIQTNSASIVLQGTAAQILNSSGGDALASLASNSAAGQFTLQDGAHFTTAGSFTNQGTLTVRAGSTFTATALTNFNNQTLSGGNYSVGGTFRFANADIRTNASTIVLDGTAAAIQDLTGLDALANFTTNAAAASYTTQNGRTFSFTSSFVNNGTLGLGTGGTSTLHAGDTVHGTGTLVLSGGTLDVTGSGTATIDNSVTNRGLIRIASSSTTLTVNGTLTSFDSVNHVLSEGTYEVGGTLKFPNADIRTNAATIVLDGTASAIQDLMSIDGLAGFSTNTAAASFTIRNGRTITRAGSFTNAGSLTIGSGSTFTVTTLTNFANGTLTGGSFIVSGTLKFTGADIRTNAATVVLDGAAAAIVNESNANALTQLATNAAGAGFTLQNGATLSTAGSFSNAGTWTLATGSTLTLGGTFTSTGSFNWTGGTLAGAHDFLLDPSARMNISSDATKSLSGPVLRNRGIVTWSGPGDIVISSPSQIFNLAGAVFDAQSDARFVNSGGNLLPFNNLGIFRKSAGSGSTTFTAGVPFQNMTTFLDYGTLVVQTGKVTWLGTNDFLNFNGQTLTGGAYALQGQLQFPNADIRTNAAAIILDGRSSGIVNQMGDDGLINLTTNVDRAGSISVKNGRLFTINAAVFNNPGTLSIGSNSQLIISGTFNQTGVALLEAGGILTLAGGGASLGRFALATGAVLDFAAGAFTIDPSTSFTGPGLVRVSGATVTVSAALTVQNLDLSGGTGILTGPGILTTTGNFTWSKGMLAGTGVVNILSGSVLTISGPDDKPLAGPILSNAGTIRWSGAGNVLGSNGSRLNNLAGATLEVQGDAGFTNMLDAGIIFSNSGTVKVSAGTLFIAGAFTNFDGAGTLTGGSYVVAGTLQFIGAQVQTNAANITLDGPNAAIVDENGNDALATFAVNKGKFTIQNGALVNTTVDFTNFGTLTLGQSSIFTTAGNLNLDRSGTLEIHLAGDSQTGQFGQLVTMGQANVAGTLTVVLDNGFQPNSADQFQIVSSLSENGRFDNINPPPGWMVDPPDYEDLGITIKLHM
jgi:hypothetical protein